MTVSLAGAGILLAGILFSMAWVGISYVGTIISACRMDGSTFKWTLSTSKEDASTGDNLDTIYECYSQHQYLTENKNVYELANL
jgi:hypothetical protein